nr:PEP-CTERM sorting domain-containing protein [uncultured Deefgea sp.]
MKFNFAAFICFICLQAQAAITQPRVLVDTPVVSVRAGKQDNGTVGVEQLFTNNTRSAQDSLSGSVVPFSRSSGFSGSGPRSAPAAFASLPETPIIPPTTIIPPANILPSPVIPAVPEPDTYALMAIGLSGLLLARRQRSKR